MEIDLNPTIIDRIFYMQIWIEHLSSQIIISLEIYTNT